MMPRWNNSNAHPSADPVDAVSSPRSLQMLLRRITDSTLSIPRFGPNLPSVTYSGPSPLSYLSGVGLCGREFARLRDRDNALEAERAHLRAGAAARVDSLRSGHHAACQHTVLA